MQKSDTTENIYNTLPHCVSFHINNNALFLSFCPCVHEHLNSKKTEVFSKFRLINGKDLSPIQLSMKSEELILCEQNHQGIH